MSTVTAISSGVVRDRNTIFSRPELLSAAVGFVAGLAIFVILRVINADPFPFLIIVGNMIANFGCGLILRIVWAEDHTLRRRTMRLGAVIPPLSVVAGMLVGVVLMFGLTPITAIVSSEVSAKDVAAMSSLVQGLVIASLILGAAVGAFATVASIPMLFLGFPLALYLTWIIGPMLATVYIAMTNWEGVGLLSEARFLAFDNFNRLFKDRNFFIALGNNVKWLLFFLTIPTSMGLGLAMIFNTKFPGARFFKIAFFAPLIIAPTVVGIIWSSMYQPDQGLINSFLRFFVGTETKLPGWLADLNLALWCIIFAAAWRQVGYVMILYLAGLKSLTQHFSKPQQWTARVPGSVSVS